MLLNKKRKGGAYTAKRDYLLSGKFFCGYCGSAMQGYSCCTRGNMYYYYSCARKDRVPADRCKQKMIRAEVIEHWIMSTLKREIFSDAGIQRVADSMSTAFGNANKEVKNATTVLQQRKAAAERKLNNLYQVIEDGDADEFDMQRLKKAKEELRNINNEICETAVKSAPDIDTSKIISLLKNMREEIFAKKNSHYAKQAIELLVKRVTIIDKTITLSLTTEGCLSLLVPRTGIEPVRVSLPEGF